MNPLFERYSDNTIKKKSNTDSYDFFNNFLDDEENNKNKIVYDNTIYNKTDKINPLIERYADKKTYNEFLPSRSNLETMAQNTTSVPTTSNVSNNSNTSKSNDNDFWSKIRSNEDKVTNSPLFKAFESIGDLPYKIPFTQRILKSAGNTVAGDGAMVNSDGSTMTSKDTGSNLGNAVADIIGTGLGYSMPVGGIGKGGSTSSFQNVANEAIKPLEKLIPETTSKLGEYGVHALKSGAEFGGLNAVQGLAQGQNAEDIKNSAIEGALSGAVFGTALKGLGDIKNNAFPEWKTTFESNMPDKTKPIMSSKYNIKNTELEKAQQNYDGAAKQIQDYWGHWNLDYPEIKLGSEELGIDLNKIFNDMRKAETNGTDVRAIAENQRLKRLAGADTSNVPELTKPIVKSNENILGSNIDSIINPIGEATYKPGTEVLFNNKPYILGDKSFDGQYDLLNSSGKPVLSTSPDNFKIKSVFEDIQSNPSITKDSSIPASQEAAASVDSFRELRAEKNKLIRDYVDMINEGKADQADGINNRIKEIDDVLGERSPLPDEIFSKDKKKISLSRETFDRNLEDIFGSDAGTFKELYSNPIKSSEADSVRFKDKLRNEVKALNLNRKESELVQKIGENKMSLKEIENVQGVDWKKVSNAVDYFKGTYKNLLKQANDVLIKNGYKPIGEIQNYFPHFEELNPILKALGIENPDLPTDINGLTGDFTPGKSFFANALHRTGDKTVFDAVRGFDNYLEGISKVIHHTDNIQRIRSLERDIRTIYKNKTDLTNFAAYLHEYGNMLAGKKAVIDRGTEDVFGRGTYKFFDFIRKQTGAQMVGGNISSALTNFIPLTQAISTTSKPSFVKGLVQSVIDTIPGLSDDFAKKSDFLTRREGSNKLYLTKWQKVGEAANGLFKVVDNLVGQTIVRGKYNELIAKGIPEKLAIKQADDWAGRIMADRSLGQIPTLFNSKVLGAFTQFQLETNNQISFLFKDIPRTVLKNGVNAKSVSTLASTATQIAVVSYIFNNIYEKVVGRRPAFDLLGVISDASKDFNNPKLDRQKAINNLVDNISNQLPFSSIITGGGKIPITSSLPDLYSLGAGKTDIKTELSKIPLMLLPTGGNQIKKTVQGFNAINNQGVYSKDGSQLKYPVKNTLGNDLKAALLGPSSLEEAQNYYRNGMTPLSKDETQKYVSDVKKGVDPKAIYELLNKVKDQNKAISDNHSKAKEEIIQELYKGNTSSNMKSVFDKYNIPNDQRKDLYTSAKNEVKNSNLSLIQSKFKSMSKQSQKAIYNNLNPEEKKLLLSK